MLGVAGGVRQEEEHLEEARGEADPGGRREGAAEREVGERERVAAGGRVAEEGDEELVAEDEGDVVNDGEDNAGDNPGSVSGSDPEDAASDMSD